MTGGASWMTDDAAARPVGTDGAFLKVLTRFRGAR